MSAGKYSYAPRTGCKTTLQLLKRKDLYSQKQGFAMRSSSEGWLCVCGAQPRGSCLVIIEHHWRLRRKLPCSDQSKQGFRRNHCAAR